MKTKELSLKDAKELVTWQYEEEYSIYNEPSWEEMVKQKRHITIPSIRKEQYVKVIDDNNNFIGYGRIREIFDNYLVGFGMNPIYCGKGLGKEFINTIIKDLKGTIILEVRESNKRAIKCYKSVGFKTIDKKYLEDSIKSEYVCIMELKK